MLVKLSVILCCALLCLLASCVDSERPLSDISKADQDSRLYGAWSRTKPDGDVEFLHIGRETNEPLAQNREQPEAGLMRFCTITHAQTGALSKAGEGRFFCTKVGDDDFASWTFSEPKEKQIVYWFAKYRVDKEQLVIWDQDAEATARAIEAGKLKGVVERKKDAAGVTTGEFEKLRITDTSENIAAFFSGGGAKTCFPDKLKSVYSRTR